MKISQRGNDRGGGNDARRNDAALPEVRSPPELDEAILKAARRAVRFQWLHELLDKLHLTRESGWQILVALALGMLAGIGLEALLERSTDSAPSGVIHAGDPWPEKQTEEGGPRSSPESWLRWIAGLVLSGEVESARDELRAFGQRYPEYADEAHSDPRTP